MNKKLINIGVIGLGNIGSYFCNEIIKKKKEIYNKVGKNINLLYVSARNKNKKRKYKFKKNQWINKPINITKNSNIDVVVELVGGSDGLAKKIVISALNNKKHVITANKALIAKHGNYLSLLAEKNKVNLEFEASVAGGIPIIRGIKEGLLSNKISKLIGILNGTSNYILTEMEHSGKKFSDVLKEAQNSGFAEKNPKNDLNGNDVSSKIKILSSLCFKSLISNSKILTNGIENIEVKDINIVKKLGYRIKLLGITEIINNNIFERVHPSLVRINSYIANINGVFNATIISGKPVGQSIMQGEGAGPGPTTSSLISDLYSIIRGNIKNPFIVPHSKRKKIKIYNYNNYIYACYFRFEVKDKSGVLASITNILAKNKISIETLIQDPNKKNKTASIIIITHKTTEKRVINCIASINKNKNIIKKPTFIRVGNFNDD